VHMCLWATGEIASPPHGEKLWGLILTYSDGEFDELQFESTFRSLGPIGKK
jgi:hypothetical protein